MDGREGGRPEGDYIATCTHLLFFQNKKIIMYYTLTTVEYMVPHYAHLTLCAVIDRCTHASS